LGLQLKDSFWDQSVRYVVTWAIQAIRQDQANRPLAKITFRESLEAQGCSESFIGAYIGDCQLLVPLLIYAVGEDKFLEKLNPYLLKMGLQSEDPNLREPVSRIVAWAIQAIEDYRRRKLDGGKDEAVETAWKEVATAEAATKALVEKNAKLMIELEALKAQLAAAQEKGK
jgi:hypothetical protein